MSRPTVRKVLRSEATEFVCVRRPQPRPKTGTWQSELEGILEENLSRPKRERMTLMRIFEDLRASGYEGDDREADHQLEPVRAVQPDLVQPAVLQIVDRRLHPGMLPARRRAQAGRNLILFNMSSCDSFVLIVTGRRAPKAT